MSEIKNAAWNLIKALDRYERAVRKIAPPVTIEKCRHLRIVAIKSISQNGDMDVVCVKDSVDCHPDSYSDNGRDKKAKGESKAHRR